MKLTDPMPYKWRIQSAKFGKATCVAYIDARQVMDRLDEVVGGEFWQSQFYEAGGLLFCKIGIYTDRNGIMEWIWKSDTGTESNIEKDKGHASDAFKRAAVQWGIGRFLYNLEIVKLPTKEKNGREYPYCKEKDQIIYDGDTLTKYINWLNGRK